MKKLLALLMTLTLMIVPFATLAESEAATYLHEDGTFGFAYPSNWFAISRELINDALNDAEIPGALGELFTQLKPMMDEMDIVMILNLATSDSINVVRQDLGQEASAERLLEVARLVKNQMEQMDPTIEFIGEPALMDSFDGARTYAVSAYTMNDVQGIPVQVMQATTVDGTMQYTLTLTVYSTEEAAFAEAVEAMATVMDTLMTWEE